MKKASKIILSAVVLSTSFGGVAMNANAAEVSRLETNGKVGFKEDSNANGPVVKPGSQNPIMPETGASSQGPLRIEHVPAFNFDTQNISSMNRSYNALYEQFKEVDTTGAAIGSPKDIPHFTQIVDERGGVGQWKLKLASGQFINDLDATNILVATHIEFSEGKQYNTNGDAYLTAEPLSTDSILKVITPSASTPIVIGNNGVAVELQSVKTAKTTDGSKTSLVFNSSYAPEIPTDGGTVNSGVSLVVPGSDIKKKNATYTANLTWTLEDSI